MSNAAKTGTILVILVVLIVVGLVWYMNGSDKADLNTYTGPTGDVVENTSIDPNDRSDAAISADLILVDRQFDGLDSDTANMDQSLSAQ